MPSIESRLTLYTVALQDRVNRIESCLNRQSKVPTDPTVKSFGLQIKGQMLEVSLPHLQHTHSVCYCVAVVRVLVINTVSTHKQEFESCHPCDVSLSHFFLDNSHV